MGSLARTEFPGRRLHWGLGAKVASASVFRRTRGKTSGRGDDGRRASHGGRRETAGCGLNIVSPADECWLARVELRLAKSSLRDARMQPRAADVSLPYWPLCALPLALHLPSSMRERRHPTGLPHWQRHTRAHPRRRRNPPPTARRRAPAVGRTRRGSSPAVRVE